MYDILNCKADWNTESTRSAIYSIFSTYGAYFEVSRQKYHILMFYDKKLFLYKTEQMYNLCQPVIQALSSPLRLSDFA